MGATSSSQFSSQTKEPAVIDGLWNDLIDDKSYGSSELYHQHVFEQYKLCIEMADRISARRSFANTFFLTLHTLIVGIAGFVFETGPQVTNPWLNIFPLIVVLVLCYVWYRLIQSYKQLNSAKYLVIGEFERRLPTSPYYRAEWKALGEGKVPSLYKPLTDVEKYVPIVFILIYILAFGTLLFQAS